MRLLLQIFAQVFLHRLKLIYFVLQVKLHILLRGHFGLVTENLLAEMSLPLEVLLTLLCELSREFLAHLIHFLSDSLDYVLQLGV